MSILPRIAHYGSKGRDVLAHQRALTACGIRHKKNSGAFGSTTLSNVKAFQTRNHLHVDGVIGEVTFGKMRPWYDGYGVWLLNHTDLTPDVRKRIVHAGMYGVFRTDEIHYSQGPNRMDWLKQNAHIPAFPHYTDCSGFTTWAYWDAGAPDPNGFGYNGYGFTGTMTSNGHVVGTPAVGDLVFYGYPVEHVAIYAGNGGKVVSHGSEAGPLLLSMHYRSDLNHCRSYL